MPDESKRFEGPTEGSDDSGISRRDVLKTAGVAGAGVIIAWATPVVTSILPRAAAQVTGPPGCTQNFLVKIEIPHNPDEDPCVCVGGAQTTFCPPGQTGDDGCGLVTIVSCGPDEVIVEIPQNCQVLSASSKCGGGCADADVRGNRATFSRCPTGPGGRLQDISHIELLFCC